MAIAMGIRYSFNTQPPEGGWNFSVKGERNTIVSTHSRLKAAGHEPAEYRQSRFVSTHSRLKAAGFKNHSLPTF